MDSMLHVRLDPPVARYAAPELPGSLNCEFGVSIKRPSITYTGCDKYFISTVSQIFRRSRGRLWVAGVASFR
jgi:hypothetical protein